MKLTRERALELHRQMWTDMQRDLGDCPTAEQRIRYKSNWCKRNSFERINFNCFLCEYTYEHTLGHFMNCDKCPIVWGDEDDPYCFFRHCCGVNDDSPNSYYNMPISQLLTLPERNIEE